MTRSLLKFRLAMREITNVDVSENSVPIKEIYEANRILTELKKTENQEKKLALGYWRGIFCPAFTWACSIAISAAAVGHFFIFPLTQNSREMRQAAAGGAYSQASQKFMQGETEAARALLKPALEKNPNFLHGNILMAKIEFSDGNPSAALKCLKSARKVSLDPKEIDTWIANLETVKPINP